MYILTFISLIICLLIIIIILIQSPKDTGIYSNIKGIRLFSPKNSNILLESITWGLIILLFLTIFIFNIIMK